MNTRLISVTMIFLLAFATSVHAKDLSREKVTKIFMEQGWTEVKIHINADYREEYSKLLAEEGFVGSHKRGSYTWTPRKTIMPYLIALTEYKGQEWYDEWTKIPQHTLWYGTIKGVETTGITTIDASNKTARVKLQIDPNKLGKMLFNKKYIFIVLNFKLFDDGWKYEKFDWTKTQELDDWNSEFLQGLSNKVSVISSILWNMHELQKYYGNYMEMVRFLESNTDNINMLDTVAWVYKDNGNAQKAIDIYEKQIMPVVREELGLKDRKKFEKYFQKIKVPSNQ